MGPKAPFTLVEADHARLSISRQRELLSIRGSAYYHQPIGQSAQNLELMRLLDEQHLGTPVYGARQMTRHLRREGHKVNRKRIGRLMQMMGSIVQI
jgi:putative transposase